VFASLIAVDLVELACIGLTSSCDLADLSGYRSQSKKIRNRQYRYSHRAKNMGNIGISNICRALTIVSMKLMLVLF